MTAVDFVATQHSYFAAQVPTPEKSHPEKNYTDDLRQLPTPRALPFSASNQRCMSVNLSVRVTHQTLDAPSSTRWRLAGPR